MNKEQFDMTGGVNPTKTEIMKEILKIERVLIQDPRFVNLIEKFDRGEISNTQFFSAKAELFEKIASEINE